MRKRGGIDNDAAVGPARLLNPAHQLAFAVALPEFYAQAQRLTRFPAALGNILKGLPAIDFGFPLPERIQVWAVEDKDGRRFRQRCLAG